MLLRQLELIYGGAIAGCLLRSLLKPLSFKSVYSLKSLIPPYCYTGELFGLNISALSGSVLSGWIRREGKWAELPVTLFELEPSAPGSGGGTGPQHLFNPLSMS